MQMTKAGSTTDDLAREYVTLVLALGEHDDGYVDAYYGPPEWQAAMRQTPPSLEAIHQRATELQHSLTHSGAPSAGSAPSDATLAALLNLRQTVLTRQLGAVVARVEQLQGRSFGFDEESQALYDAVAPHHTEDEFDPILAQLEAEVPGSGPLAERVEAYREQFVVPPERLAAIFDAAIEEARQRTRRHFTLPEGERFTVEYVTDQPWSGYNWYQGQYTSLIQVNTEFPIFVDRAVDLAAHEGYPGHHVFNSLLEHQLVRQRGWLEFSVYALYSPQSLIAEGTANFGVDLAFPEADRLTFEREVLFPLAGLDPATAAPYARLLRAMEALSFAGNEAARRYLEGQITAEQAAQWLVKYTLTAPDRARQRVRFYDRYRSYVINYNVGKALVQRHVAARVGQSGLASANDDAWRAFLPLISTPQVPSTLDCQ